MLILATGALALTSGLTGYYIYSYHAQHFKETLFLKSVEIYSRAKIKYREYVPRKTQESSETQNQTQEPLIQIKDVKIIRNQEEIINFDPLSFHDLKWEHLAKESLVHVIYAYQDCDYRIVFSHNQDLTLLTSNLNWLQEGLLNGIEQFESNLSYPNLRELMHQYAGPLGDFYKEAEIEQDHHGFLILDLDQYLFQGQINELINESPNQYNPYIKVINILGETQIFGYLGEAK